MAYENEVYLNFAVETCLEFIFHSYKRNVDKIVQTKREENKGKREEAKQSSLN